MWAAPWNLETLKWRQKKINLANMCTENHKGKGEAILVTGRGGP
jgi:hypothetical protein